MKNYEEYILHEALRKSVKTGGDCFVVNGLMFINDFMDEEGWALVHGYVTSTTQDRVRFIHCWIENEKDNLVKDYSNGNKIEMDRRAYYAIGNVEKKNLKKYSIEEVEKKILKSKNWGPWDLR